MCKNNVFLYCTFFVFPLLTESFISDIIFEKGVGAMTNIKAPFFEIGPKSYLYGQDVIDLAIAADQASEKYDVDIIFTTPVVEIARVDRKSVV